MTSHPRLWLPRPVRDEVVAQVLEHDSLETGGILLGYIALSRIADGPGDVVVVDAVGAGPRAEHYEHSFEPDHDWQVAELAERYERSGGVAGYVGDWHSHPHGASVPSRQDLRTMRSIARHVPARLDRPTMLILSTGSRHDIDAPELRAWQWAPRPLMGRIGWFTLPGASELRIVDVDGPV